MLVREQGGRSARVEENDLVPPLEVAFPDQVDEPDKGLRRVNRVEDDPLPREHQADDLGHVLGDDPVTVFDVLVEDEDVFGADASRQLQRSLRRLGDRQDVLGERQLGVGDADADDAGFFGKGFRADDESGLRRPRTRRVDDVIGGEAQLARLFEGFPKGIRRS